MSNGWDQTETNQIDDFSLVLIWFGAIPKKLYNKIRFNPVWFHLVSFILVNTPMLGLYSYWDLK